MTQLHMLSSSSHLLPTTTSALACNSLACCSGDDFSFFPPALVSTVSVVF